MSKSIAVLMVGWLAGASMSAGESLIQLKDRASVTGTILVEKPDQVVVDVGYTVLVIPRGQVSRISSASTPPAGLPTPAGTTKPLAARPETVSRVDSNRLYRVAASPGPERSVREQVALVGEAVVQIRTPSSIGSGFLLNEDGFLITNFHVIEGETQLGVEVYHQKRGQLERHTYKDVRIVAMNKFQDLALLKIEDKDAPHFAWVPMGDTSSLSVGERVFAVGSPLGLERTVTEGIVSTKTRQLQGGLYLQTSTQINPGNSGGPLFNLRGEVIGVTNMKLTTGEGLGFAIPVEMVKYFLDHRDAFAYDNDNPSNGYRYLEPPSRRKPVVSAKARP